MQVSFKKMVLQQEPEQQGDLGFKEARAAHFHIPYMKILGQVCLGI